MSVRFTKSHQVDVKLPNPAVVQCDVRTQTGPAVQALPGGPNFFACVAVIGIAKINDQ